MAKSFKGIAYFTGTDLDHEWGQRAAALLAPIQGVGGKAAFEGQRDAWVLHIAFDKSVLNVPLLGGRSQGMIKAMPKAGALLACLVAIRGSIGKLQIVDDEQKDIPVRVRQSNRLYAADWPLVQQVAECVGLVGTANFMQQHAGMLGRLI
ncbi:MAG: hypothetical protein OEL20_04505 [Sulfuritalea sp.]|nr:hypothetical protein [Sulfuritalea sp.]